MGVFRRDKPTKMALDRLQERLEELAGKLEGHESAIKKLELEWIETYDKVRHQLSRMAKRGTLPDVPDPPTNGPEAPSEGSQLDPISAKIHERRNRSFLGRE